MTAFYFDHFVAFLELHQINHDFIFRLQLVPSTSMETTIDTFTMMNEYAEPSPL